MSDFFELHNPDWDKIKEIGLNMKWQEEQDRQKNLPEKTQISCARCGRVKPDDGMSGPFGYGPKNNLCDDCWHLDDIDEWLESH
jgi:hypothetical protein